MIINLVIKSKNIMDRNDLVEGYIDNVEILGIEIILKGDHTDKDIDLGSVTVTAEDREYCMDVIQSYRTYDEDNDSTSIELKLTTTDEDDVFPDCPFDIKGDDLMLENSKVTLYFFCEDESVWESCTLEVKRGDITKEIDVDLDE